MSLNKVSFRRSMLGLAAGSILAAGSAQADMTVRLMDEPDKATSVIMIKDGMIRIEDSEPEGERSITIYDSKQKKVIVLMEEDKKYYELTEESMRGQMSQLKDMQQQVRAQMEEQLRDLPPEQRRMVEQQMGQLGMGMQKAEPPDYATRRTGRSMSVAGVRCDVYETSTNGKKSHESCVASPGALKMSSADHKTLMSMVEFMGRMADMALESLGAGGHDATLEFTREFKDGLPIHMKDFEDGTTTVMQSHSNAGVSADHFRIPAGYTRADMQ